MVDYYKTRIFLEPNEVPKEWINILPDLPSPITPLVNPMDGKPAHLFFLLMAPENSTGAHLQMLARISRLLKDSTLRQRLMTAADQHELYALIEQEDGAS